MPADPPTKVLVGCLFLLASLASAQPLDAAKAQFQQGTEAYRAGRFEDAIRAYATAYQLDPKPGILFDIGQCYRKEGDLGSAATFYRRYLEAYPEHTAPDEKVVRQLLKEMQASLERPEPPPEPVQARAVDAGKVAPPPAEDRPTAVALTPVPAPEPPPLLKANITTQRDDDSVLHKWWFWTGAGVVVAGVATSAVILSEPHPRNPTLGTQDLR